MVCGCGESVGHDTRARKLTGAQSDQTARLTAWSRRPHAPRQLTYALADVNHLRTIYHKLVRRLEKSGRASWLDEEMAILASPETYRLVPEEDRKSTRLNSSH